MTWSPMVKNGSLAKKFAYPALPVNAFSAEVSSRGRRISTP
ncbi:hypothetical protein ACWCQE_22380 [Streptomyces sp. NPDC002409]